MTIQYYETWHLLRTTAGPDFTNQMLAEIRACMAVLLAQIFQR